MYSFTERTACIRKQVCFLNYSRSWLKKANYLFCSSSSSFLFIMATIAWRSSSKKKEQKGLMSVCIFAHVRSRSHVHRQHTYDDANTICYSAKHIKMLLISSLISAIFQKRCYLTLHQKYWSNQISLHLALIQMFTSVLVGCSCFVFATDAGQNAPFHSMRINEIHCYLFSFFKLLLLLPINPDTGNGTAAGRWE